MELADYLRLKKDVEHHRQRLERSRGALQQLMDQLREEYGLTSREEMEKEVKRLQKELARLDSVFTTAVQRWQKRWEDKTR